MSQKYILPEFGSDSDDDFKSLMSNEHPEKQEKKSSQNMSYKTEPILNSQNSLQKAKNSTSFITAKELLEENQRTS